MNHYTRTKQTLNPHVTNKQYFHTVNTLLLLLLLLIVPYSDMFRRHCHLEAKG
jgi:hypothetical protein